MVAAVVSGYGAMMFLGIVAQAVEGREKMLVAFDKAERAARRRREQSEDEEEDPVVVEAVKAPAA